MGERGHVPHDDLVEKFSQSVGVEKARDTIAEGLDAAGVERKEWYTTDEVIDVCEEIHFQHSGYIGIVANKVRVNKEAEKRFVALLNNVPDPALVADFEGRDPVIRLINDAFERVFGYDLETARGARLDDLLMPDHEQDLDHTVDLWARSTGGAPPEVQLETADGELRTFLVRTALGQREAADVEGYAIYTDITERKQRERKLQHQNKQLDQFASIVSHDLRNPLNVAEGLVETAIETGDVDYLEDVQEAHDRMKQLIDDALTLAREGRTIEETDPTDLGVVAREAWSNVDTGDATLTIDIDRRIDADRTRLLRAFENLFRNSVEHGSTGSRPEAGDSVEHGRDDVEVRVGATDATLDDPVPPERRGFFVADDGSGIPPDLRDRVLDDGFTTSDEGTGLGLSIVTSIVEAHGWAIAVTESETGGARFEVTGVDVARRQTSLE